jgi:hypothetical protein
VDFALAGFCWGLLALALGARAFGRTIWPAVLLSPLIGILVGALVQPVFERRGGLGRSLAVLGSLYLGATLFGIAIAIGQWSRFRAAPLVMSGEAVLGTWWGVTFTGFVLFLWPIGYLTHWILEQRAG